MSRRVSGVSRVRTPLGASPAPEGGGRSSEVSLKSGVPSRGASRLVRPARPVYTRNERRTGTRLRGNREARLGREAFARFVPVTTRWSDNDPYGHLNNVIYYAFFDAAVNALLIEAGL